MASALLVTTVPITLEAFLAPFALHFRARGWRVDALANGAPDAPSLAGVFDDRFDIAWTRSPRCFLHLPALARRVREVVRGGYDIVHVHTPIAAFITRFALRRLRGAARPTVVYTAHGFHFYRGGRRIPNAIYRTMERRAAHWTDFLVTINAEDYEAARAFGTIDPQRVRRIPGIGVDPAPYAKDVVSVETARAVRTDLGVEPDSILLLMIAEFGAVKRHLHLLEALRQTADERVVVVFAGEGPLEDTVRARADALGLNERVRFAGYRRDIPELLAASDALVLVSEREGLPRSMLEAMAAGRPLIGTDTRGIADLASTGAGWVAPKHDTAALATTIDEAVASPAELARRGAVGRELVQSVYALPLIIDAYEELYREALASRV